MNKSIDDNLDSRHLNQSWADYVKEQTQDGQKFLILAGKAHSSEHARAPYRGVDELLDIPTVNYNDPNAMIENKSGGLTPSEYGYLQAPDTLETRHYNNTSQFPSGPNFFSFTPADAGKSCQLYSIPIPDMASSIQFDPHQEGGLPISAMDTPPIGKKNGVAIVAPAAKRQP